MESKYPPHPYATAFTLMEGDAFRDLVTDVQANGLRVPIVLAKHDAEWCLLDGRNRERACFEAGVKPKYDYYDGDNPKAYVKSLNHHRRHQNSDQRALCAARLADMKVGNPQFRQSAGMTIAEAAKENNVSERSAERAKAVINKGEPDVVDALEQGEISLSKAEEIARLTRAQQLDALDQAKNSEPTRQTKVQRDGMMSIALLLKESEVMALRALVEAGEWFAERDARARDGVNVLLRLAPMVRK